jgi:hypothetical protein
MASKQVDQVDKECQHEEIIMDYLHALGCATGIYVAALRTSVLVQEHPKMEIINPRCAQCGAKLSYREIEGRISKGGDLHHPHFIWCEQRQRSGNVDNKSTQHRQSWD